MRDGSPFGETLQVSTPSGQVTPTGKVRMFRGRQLLGRGDIEAAFLHAVRMAGVAGAIALSGAPLAAQTSADSLALRRVAMERALEAYEADTTRDLQGVLVQQHGLRLVERYFNGQRDTTLHDIRSAAKSVTSMLVGLMLQQRSAYSLDSPLGVLLPGALTAAQQPVRLRDVLTMRAGFDSDDDDTTARGNEVLLDESEDWMAFLRAVTMKYPPGQRYVYSSLTAFVAGRVVEQQMGLPLSDFARRALFEPIGIRRFVWRRGPKGEGVGQGNLFISLRDMTALGELVLRHGRVNGQALLDSAYLAASLTAHVAIGDVDPFADSYGYMWYTRTYNVDGEPLRVHFASGNGGNKIYIIPQRDAVLTIASRAYGRRHGQRRSERILLEVLPLLQR